MERRPRMRSLHGRFVYARANLTAFSTASVPALKNAAFAGPREGREREQPFGERHVDLVGDDREVGVQEPRGLLLHRLDDPRMRVADVQAADAAREVEERVAVDVGQRRAASLGGDDRQVDRERIGDDAILPLEDRPGLRARGSPSGAGSRVSWPSPGHDSEALELGRRQERQRRRGAALSAFGV